MRKRNTKAKRTDADRDTVGRFVRWSKDIDRWLEETAQREGFKTPQDKVRKILFERKTEELAA